jgi:hypothetical protein
MAEERAVVLAGEAGDESGLAGVSVVVGAGVDDAGAECAL